MSVTGDMRLVITALTHRGAVRRQNEDTIAVAGWLHGGSMMSPHELAIPLDAPVLCLVADGMGGHACGADASWLAAANLSAGAAEASDGETLTALLRNTNRMLFASMSETRERQGMGSTVVGLLASPEGLWWFNVGDSRIYRFRDGFLRQLSIDDVPDPDAPRERRSHRITQSLGGAHAFVEIYPHCGQEPLVPGWSYLLCSDGLTDELDIESIESTLCEVQRPVSSLFEQAMAAGGKDNVSILLVRVEAGDDVGLKRSDRATPEAPTLPAGIPQPSQAEEEPGENSPRSAEDGKGDAQL